ncbi:hypothetical protein BJ508DRAFT_131301 [Ascobolus immersus RN42]|uniref:Uncharacterized protein n=1 Tax=Ascobolus immersus RN42 TaxID=1160509 RepID=A0A3N4I7M7_ASCIM|nr:hypothetical protein BJ508DRAFT_131301 [Ascobolus immersus RN42]
MPSLLLPGTAAPFAPRSAPTVVLNTKVDPWLTATLKRINRVKRPLNSAPQHVKCLTETLSSPSAIWTLCSLLVERAPDSEIEKHDHPLIDALFRYQLLHIQAYVVHIDMVLSNEIAFKLTDDTIKDLIEFHEKVYLVDCAARTWQWTDKESQIKKLHDNFVQTVNKYVFRTDAIALEGMEDDGAGELLCGGSLEVKQQVQGFFVPLLPPPPRVVEQPRPVPLLPSSPTSNWWAPTIPVSGSSEPAPVDAWKVLPSSPASDIPVSSGAPVVCTSSMWEAISAPELPSINSPLQQYCTAATTQAYYSSAPIPSLPLPSLVAHQHGGCSTMYGGGFGWDNMHIPRYAEYTPTM